MTMTDADSVAEFVSSIASEWPRARWILITWLDSAAPNAQSPTLRHALAGRQGARWLEAGLSVEVDQLSTLVSEEVFNGFDQIVLFEQEPVDVAVCPAIVTTDRDVDAEAEAGLRSWLRSIGATALVADGVGLRLVRA